MWIRTVVILWFASIVTDAITTGSAGVGMLRMRQGGSRIVLYTALRLLMVAAEGAYALVRIAIAPMQASPVQRWLILGALVLRLGATAISALLILALQGYIKAPPVER